MLMKEPANAFRAPGCRTLPQLKDFWCFGANIPRAMQADIAAVNCERGGGADKDESFCIAVFSVLFFLFIV